MTFRPLPILTLCTIASLVILTLLGNWQYAKFVTKTAEEAAGPPEWDTLSYTEGAFRPAFIYTVLEGRPVWKAIDLVAYETQTGERANTYRVVALYEGQDPPRLSDLDAADGQSVQQIEGQFLQPNGRGRFTLEARLDERAWYAFDAEEIAAAMGERVSVGSRLFEPRSLPLIYESGTARPIQNPFADPRLVDALPPQRHFGYALTWWGLAIALFIMYFVFHHSRGRLRFRTAK